MDEWLWSDQIHEEIALGGAKAAANGALSPEE